MTEFSDEDIWGSSASTNFDPVDYITKAASARGIDPNVALRVAKSEGLNGYTGDNGTSFGPFQLHYGTGARHGYGQNGMGDDFTAQTGLDARDPNTQQQQIDFALDHAKKNGWGAWYGARRAGITGMHGIDQQAMALSEPQPYDAAQEAPPQELSDEDVWGGQTAPQEGSLENAPRAPQHPPGFVPAEGTAYQRRQEPYAGLPLEQAWASDPISQGLSSAMENSDVQTGLLAVGMHPELMATREIAAGVNLMKERRAATPPKAPKPESLSAGELKTKLKDESQVAYKEAADAGVEVAPESYRNMVTGLVSKLESQKINEKLHGDTFAGAKQLIDNIDRSKASGLGGSLEKATGVIGGPRKQTYDIEELDKLRQSASIARKGYDPQKADDRRLAEELTDHMDDWMNNLTTKDVAAGDPQKAVAALKKARESWAKMRRVEELDIIHQKALHKVGSNYTNAGLQTAYKQLYRNLLDSKRIRNFSEEERRAMKMIVGGTKSEQVLRFLGKYAPTSPLSFMLGGGAGYAAVGGVPGAAIGAAVATGGTAARALSTHMTKKNVQSLIDMVGRGEGH